MSTQNSSSTQSETINIVSGSLRTEERTALLPPDTFQLTFYTVIHVDDGKGAVSRARNKQTVKGTRVKAAYDSLLISTRSIIRAVQGSELAPFVRGRRVFIYAFPEWEGQPRLLAEMTDERKKELVTVPGGDYVVLQHIERGFFLKVEPHDRQAEKGGFDDANSTDQEQSAAVKEQERELPAIAEQMHLAQPAAKPVNLDSGRIAPLAPECLSYCTRLTSRLPEITRRRNGESIQNYFTRVSRALDMTPTLGEVWPNITASARCFSRFEILQAIRLRDIYVLEGRRA